jgi:hypothetical protein
VFGEQNNNEKFTVGTGGLNWGAFLGLAGGITTIIGAASGNPVVPVVGVALVATSAVNYFIDPVWGGFLGGHAEYFVNYETYLRNTPGHPSAYPVRGPERVHVGLELEWKVPRGTSGKLTLTAKAGIGHWYWSTYPNYGWQPYQDYILTAPAEILYG